MRWPLITTVCFAILANGVFANDRDTRFAEANRLYEVEEFEQARDLYRELATEHLSQEVFFNLGNTLFRLGKLGEACLWYRRALFLEPGMAEATVNLRLLHRKLGFLRFKPTGIDRFVSSLTGSTWSLIIVLGLWLFALGLAALLILRPKQPLGGIVLALTISGGLIAILAGSANYLHQERLNPSSLGIVVQNDVVAIDGPFPDGNAVITLPPGSEVRMKAKRDEWIFVHLPGENAGWVEKESVQPFWPYSAKP
ncbi:MAG: tetratricopeptide repeat protein [Verrucomicrobiota bacterium]